MKPREKKLAAICAVVIVGYLGYQTVIGALMSPLEERQTRIKGLDKLTDKLEANEANVLAAQRRMGALKDRSLPPDAYQAQRFYTSWLTDLAQISGLTNVHVTPDQIPSSNPAYRSVGVTVKGDGNFEQLTTFLYEFQRIELLHRIAGLKLEGPPNPGGPFKITINAEGLSLPDAAPRQHLFPRTQLADSLPKSFDNMKVASSEGFPKEAGFDARIESEIVTVTKINGNEWTLKRGAEGTALVRHPSKAEVELFPIRSDRANLKVEEIRKALVKHPFTAPVPVTAAAANDPNDPARLTRLMGSVDVAGGDISAWLYNKTTNTRTVVRKGSAISVGDVRGTVAAVEPNCIKIDRGGEVWQLDFGRNLRSMTRVGGNSDDGMDPELMMEGGPRGGGEFRGRGGQGGSGGRERRRSRRSDSGPGMGR